MANQLPADPTQRFFEHPPVGAVFELGSFALTQDSIIDFARQYDPPDMHVEPVLAATGPFGEVIASGWQTISLMMRLFVANFLPKNGLAAPGIDELRWPRPTRPGDTLRVECVVEKVVPSRSRPERGMVTMRCETLNQRDEAAQVMVTSLVVPRRP